jgi:hypothetical protein
MVPSGEWSGQVERMRFARLMQRRPFLVDLRSAPPAPVM